MNANGARPSPVASSTPIPADDRRQARTAELRHRLAQPDAVLTRTDLRELGYERRAVDAILRACPVEKWPGYSKPMIRVSSFLDWRSRCTYDNTRVRPTGRGA